MKSYIMVRIFAPIINLFVAIIGIFIKRDKTIVLFGSWMGHRFSDNSRFFFQYINKYIEDYKIKKAVWVTRNREVWEQLTKMGYEVYLMHSWKSFYYHLKAGVHVICNTAFTVNGIQGDIMGHLSGNAIKINMLHGIAIKAGRGTGKINLQRGVLGRIKYFLRNNHLFCLIFTPGHWDKAFYLSSSKECTIRNASFCGVEEKQFIESGFPRNNREMMATDDEEEIINVLKSYNKIILYVPTFRERGETPHPLSEKKMKEFITTNQYLWVEKPHPASKSEFQTEGLESNVLVLNSSFDINVILPQISILITDYSSVSFDAYSFDKPVIYYASDYKHYALKERGFLCDYWEMIRGFEATDIDGLVELLNLSINDVCFQEKMKEKIKWERILLFGDKIPSNEKIARTLNNHLGIFSKEERGAF